jgi:hypothetical protein
MLHTDKSPASSESTPLTTDLSPLKVEMFEEREAAAKWLGVPVESLAVP